MGAAEGKQEHAYKEGKDCDDGTMTANGHVPLLTSLNPSNNNENNNNNNTTINNTTECIPSKSRRKRKHHYDPDWCPSKSEEIISENEDDVDDVTTEQRQAQTKTLTFKSSTSRKKRKVHVRDYSADSGIAGPPLKVAAFNIQIFGTKKYGNTDVTAILVKILCRYDIIMIQEIRDSTETALDKLVAKCTEVDPENPFDVVVSERLGRGNCKEQYAFLYRTNRVSVADTYQYDDGEDNGSDTFQREPFAVRFKSETTEIDDFAIIVIHTQPSQAVKEIAGLAKVYEVTKNHWDLEDIMIAGDFNADEGYVDQEDWAKIALRNDRRFRWLIDDDTDTTVGNTDRAYDRFVVAGKKLTKNIVPGSTGVFEFDRELKLTQEEAEDVSDHFPIELEIMGRVDHDIQDNLTSNLAFEVKQKEPIKNINLIRKIYRAKEGDSADFKVTVSRDKSSMVEVVARREGVDDAISALAEFRSRFPGVVLRKTVEMIRAYLASPILQTKPFVYGLQSDETCWLTNDITIKASLEEPLLCSVEVSRKMSS